MIRLQTTSRSLIYSSRHLSPCPERIGKNEVERTTNKHEKGKACSHILTYYGVPRGNLWQSWIVRWGVGVGVGELISISAVLHTHTHKQMPHAHTITQMSAPITHTQRSTQLHTHDTNIYPKPHTHNVYPNYTHIARNTKCLPHLQTRHTN